MPSIYQGTHRFLCHFRTPISTDYLAPFRTILVRAIHVLRMSSLALAGSESDLTFGRHARMFEEGPLPKPLPRWDNWICSFYMFLLLKHPLSPSFVWEGWISILTLINQTRPRGFWVQKGATSLPHMSRSPSPLLPPPPLPSPPGGIWRVPPNFFSLSTRSSWSWSARPPGSRMSPTSRRRRRAFVAAEKGGEGRCLVHGLWACFLFMGWLLLGEVSCRFVWFGCGARKRAEVSLFCFVGGVEKRRR